MSNIRTYNALLEEKKRLETVLLIQKEILRQDLIQLREEFKPALHLLSIAGKITKGSTSNPLIAMSINLVKALFQKNMALSSSSQIARIILPFLAKKAFTHFLNK